MSQRRSLSSSWLRTLSFIDKVHQFLWLKIDVGRNLSEESAVDFLARMDWDHGSPSVLVLEEDVRTLRVPGRKSDSTEGFDYVSCLRRMELLPLSIAQTWTFFTTTSSGTLASLPLTSRYTSIASFTLLSSSFRVLAWV